MKFEFRINFNLINSVKFSVLIFFLIPELLINSTELLNKNQISIIETEDFYNKSSDKIKLSENKNFNQIIEKFDKNRIYDNNNNKILNDKSESVITTDSEFKELNFSDEKELYGNHEPKTTTTTTDTPDATTGTEFIPTTEETIDITETEIIPTTEENNDQFKNESIEETEELNLIDNIEYFRLQQKENKDKNSDKHGNNGGGFHGSDKTKSTTTTETITETEFTLDREETSTGQTLFTQEEIDLSTFPTFTDDKQSNENPCLLETAQNFLSSWLADNGTLIHTRRVMGKNNLFESKFI